MSYDLEYFGFWMKNTNSKKKSTLIGSIKVSGKLPTYPSPKSTLTLTSHLGQNVGLGDV